MDSKFRMIDVGEKTPTRRRALAEGWFHAAPETLQRIAERSLPKGDVLALAEVAGILGAKQTASLLPLCHPLALESVRVSCSPQGARGVQVQCEVVTTGKTGVEMEALAGVSAALLCIYDLAKNVDPVLSLGEVRLLLKEGGKSGIWTPPSSTASQPRETPPSIDRLQGVAAAVVTVSDSASRGEADDRSGPLLEKLLVESGCVQVERGLVADDQEAIAGLIDRLVTERGARLVVCTGGTGLSPRDVTPEAIELLVSRRGGTAIAGLGELLRSSGASHTRLSWLSRSGAWRVGGGAIVVAFPGSPKACQEGWDAVGGLLPHLLEVAAGVQRPTGHAPRDPAGSGAKSP